MHGIAQFLYENTFEPMLHPHGNEYFFLPSDACIYKFMEQSCTELDDIQELHVGDDVTASSTPVRQRDNFVLFDFSVTTVLFPFNSGR